MTAQMVLKAALRDVVGPAARAAGFRGTAPNWRCSTDSGDWAVVNVQSSSGSTSEELRCVINLAVAPVPWLDCLASSHGRMPKTVTEYLGLYRDRLHPTGTPPGTDGWWTVRDEHDAALVASDMVDRLAVDGWPVLTRLLDRSELLAEIRTGSLGRMKASDLPDFFANAEAVMLADDGPSAELEAALASAEAGGTALQRENQRQFSEWVRKRAASRPKPA